jgi:hypothetical protein
VNLTLKEAALAYLLYMEGNKPGRTHVNPIDPESGFCGSEVSEGCEACEEYQLGMNLRRAIDDDPAPQSWITATHAVCWGTWRWSADLLNDVQRWGDANCCRFILVSEVRSGWDGTGRSTMEYELKLYVAPKPNRIQTGLCAASISNRDAGLARFSPWLDGFLAGRGLPPVGGP